MQYFAYYSTGGSWISLASNLTLISYTWDTSTVPDGTNYLLKVEAISSRGLTKSSTSSSYKTQDLEDNNDDEDNS